MSDCGIHGHIERERAFDDAVVPVGETLGDAFRLDGAFDGAVYALDRGNDRDFRLPDVEVAGDLEGVLDDLDAFFLVRVGVDRGIADEKELVPDRYIHDEHVRMVRRI